MSLVLWAVVFRARTARGWTQQELADKCGVTKTVANRWESGKHGLSEATLAKVAKACGIGLRELIVEGLADAPPSRAKASGEKPRRRKRARKRTNAPG